MPDLAAAPAGDADAVEHVFPVRVYYDDTDAAGIVCYANYLRMAERARSEMLRAVGVGNALQPFVNSDRASTGERV